MAATVASATREIPLVDLKAQYRSIKPEIDAAIQAVVDQTAFVGGPYIKQFEAAFAAFCDVEHAIGVGNGSDALYIALRAGGVGPGDEVITVSHTFIATAEAVSLCGAIPVFVDIDPRTYTMDPAAFAAAITPRTKAVIPVHLYGLPADMDAIMEIARAHDILVVEDAAQAHGARYRGRRVGGIGDIACFSFYPGKNLGAYGDAGMLTTNSADLAKKVRMLRDHGRTSKYEHEFEGVSSRLDGMQAAVLNTKLRHLDGWNAARRNLAAHFSEVLAGTPATVPFVPDWAEPVWHLYVIQVPDRDALLAQLKAANIGAGIHYPLPLHRQPAYAHLGIEEGSLPVTEHVARHILSLPIYAEMLDEDAERVMSLTVNALKSR